MFIPILIHVDRCWSMFIDFNRCLSMILDVEIIHDRYWSMLINVDRRWKMLIEVDKCCRMLIDVDTDVNIEVDRFSSILIVDVTWCWSILIDVEIIFVWCLSMLIDVKPINMLFYVDILDDGRWSMLISMFINVDLESHRVNMKNSIIFKLHT